MSVQTGVNIDDQFTLTLPGMSATKLYRDNNNNYVSALSIVNSDGSLNNAGVKIAQDVITNALATVRGGQALIQAQGEIIDDTSTRLSSAIGVSKEAASGYLDTDLVQAVSEFTAALKSIYAAIATFQAGAKVADAGQAIINTAVQ